MLLIDTQDGSRCFPGRVLENLYYIRKHIYIANRYKRRGYEILAHVKIYNAIIYTYEIVLLQKLIDRKLETNYPAQSYSWLGKKESIFYSYIHVPACVTVFVLVSAT